MRSLHYVIVEVDEAYKNEKQVGDTKIIVSNSVEAVGSINRIVRVITAPEGTVLQQGDEIVIHHNILRIVQDAQGEKVRSSYWIKDNLYYVPLTEIFAYRRDGQDWKALDPFCFVEPVPFENDGDFIVSEKEESHKGMKKLCGRMAILNESLREQGVCVGDLIVFTPHSEYEFDVEGRTLYRMRTNDIVGVL